MVKISNFYTNRDMYYTELATALEGFTYGGTAKCIIHAILPLTEQNKITEKKVKNKITPNVMNKDVTPIKSELKDFTITNYINIHIPLEYAPTSEKVIYDGNMSPHTVVTRNTSGKKGEQFLINFIGGDSNTFRVIGRSK